VLLFVLAACGGGGGGGSPVEPTPTPPLTQPSLVFTPQGGGGSGVSLTAGAASTASTLILEVRANSVTDLYGVAFDLGYPANLVQYVRATQGPLLAGGTLQVAVGGGGTAGNLVVGLSNLGPVPGASGSGSCARPRACSFRSPPSAGCWPPLTTWPRPAWVASA